jgi:hypothetical protein
MSAVVTVVLLAGAILKPLIAPSRPALGRAPGVAQQAESANVEVDDASASPTPTVAHLAAWSRPTATPAPADVPPAEDLPTRRPRELRLWDGTAIPVEPATVAPETGAHRWTLPGTENVVGWHSTTPDCGEGVVVMGGHVSYDGLPGPLVDLAKIGPDDVIECVDHDGQTHRYVPRDYLTSSVEDDVTSWHPEWRPALILYTCTPELDGSLLVVRFALEEEAVDFEY